MHRMRLRGEDLLRFGFADAGREGAVGGGDVLGNVSEHVFAALDVFEEKIGGELRIKNTGGAHGQKGQQQHGNDSDEKARDDEAIAQAPEQAAPSPGEQAIEKIEGGKQRNEFQVLEDAAFDREQVGQAAGSRQQQRGEIEARDAVPDSANVGSSGHTSALDRNTTLP